MTDSQDTIDPPVVAANAALFERSPGVAQARSLFERLVAQTPSRGPRRVDRPLALYGAGRMGRMARDWCERVGIPVSLVIDERANALQADPFWRGVRVRSPAAVGERDRGEHLLAVCVATTPFEPLRQGLAAGGWRDIVPFYDLTEAYLERHPLSNGWFCPDLREDEVSGIGRVLERWADDVSRAHHLQFIAWHRLRQEWVFADAPVREDDRFFIEPIRAALGGHERFLDVGAHQGEVLARFIDACGGRFENAMAVEPDAASRAALLRRLAGLTGEGDHRIGVLPVAVGEQTRRQRFAGGLGYASQLSVLGSDEVTVHAIDELGLAPSFVKLHLEGHELAALRGARQTLIGERPMLALTVYHDRDGLYRTADWLMTRLPRYRFWLRAHSWMGTGVVVYAIPEERIR